jgi:hypothetical protein
MTEAGDDRMARWSTTGVVITLLLLLAVSLWWRTSAAPSSGVGRAARELFSAEDRAPEGVRIRVEVLNATSTPGLALSATRLLRDRGFDVVSIGNNPTRRDTTVVLDRTAHPEWARLVAGALGRPVVETRPDSSRYVDISVLLGSDWTAPTRTFHP